MIYESLIIGLLLFNLSLGLSNFRCLRRLENKPN